MHKMTSESQVHYSVRNFGGWITLDRPERRNALSPTLIGEVYECIERAVGDAEVRCIVLTGSGSAFCAGADLKRTDREQDQASQSAGNVSFPELLTAILECPKPVIAAVNGSAFGGGLGLVGAADIVIAADEAKFSFSEVRIGVIPAIISVVCLPKLGRHNGLRLFLTGEAFDGKQAVEFGLAHQSVPAVRLEESVQAEIDQIRRGGPNAVMECKKLVRRVLATDEADGFKLTSDWSQRMFRSAEAAEGMAAFRDKRLPVWNDGEQENNL